MVSSKLASKQQTRYIKLHKQPSAVLVVEFAEKAGSECEIQYSYYFLLTKPCSIEDDPMDDTIVKDIPKVYMKALGMVEFDPFLVPACRSSFPPSLLPCSPPSVIA